VKGVLEQPAVLDRVVESGDVGGRGVVESGDVGGRGIVESGDVGGRGVVESGDVGGRGVVESGDVGGRGVVESGDVRGRGGAESRLRAAAEALHVEGNLRASRDHFEAVYRAAESAGDGRMMAEAALGLSGLWVREYRTATAGGLVTERQRRALSLVDAESALALRLRIRLTAEADYCAGGQERMLAVLDEARRHGDPFALAEALSLAHQCVLGPEHSALRRTLATELIAESSRTLRRSDLLLGLLWQTVDCFLDGDPNAQRCLAELRDALAQTEHLAVRSVVETIEGMLCVRAGQFDEAQRRAEARAERGGAAQIVGMRWFQGRIAELLPMLTEQANSPVLGPPRCRPSGGAPAANAAPVTLDNSSLAALAVSAATVGERWQAAGALARLSGSDLAALPRSSSWLVSMYGVVEAAHLLGDSATSARAYELLSPFAERPIIGGRGVVCFGSVHHALGVACLTTGDLDAAVEHLRCAVQRNLALGNWPAATLSRSRLGQALAERRGPDDAHLAHRELAAAVAEATELGIVLPQRSRAADIVVCRRQNRQWRLELGPRGVLVDHSIGMLHLATLLANPGRDVPAIDLAAGPGLLATAAAERAGSSAQPVLDGVAQRAYRQRLARLAIEIDEYSSSGNPERAEQIRAERDWLVAELAAATGMAGRARVFTGTPERARVAVGKAIRRAIARVAEADPVLGAVLRATVRTGLYCVYQPE
jgi:hypothetical protein